MPPSRAQVQCVQQIKACQVLVDVTAIGTSKWVALLHCGLWAPTRHGVPGVRYPKAQTLHPEPEMPTRHGVPGVRHPRVARGDHRLHQHRHLQLQGVGAGRRQGFVRAIIVLGRPHFCDAVPRRI